jgi:hypothetical protein
LVKITINIPIPRKIWTDNIMSSILMEWRSRDSIVSTATGYRLDNQEVKVQVPVRSRIFSSPHHPDWLWGPPSLSNGYQELFSQG